MSSLIASVVFVLMASTQLAIGSELPADVDQTGVDVATELADRVHFGLDLAWDVYFTIGMALFAVLAYGHPRLGRVLGVLGFTIACTLLVLNIAEFPTPPASSGSIDLGPLSGLWYAAVTVQVIRSLGWAAERSTSVPTPPL